MNRNHSRLLQPRHRDGIPCPWAGQALRGQTVCPQAGSLSVAATILCLRPLPPPYHACAQPQVRAHTEPQLPRSNSPGQNLMNVAARAQRHLGHPGLENPFGLLAPHAQQHSEKSHQAHHSQHRPCGPRATNQRANPTASAPPRQPGRAYRPGRKPLPMRRLAASAPVLHCAKPCHPIPNTHIHTHSMLSTHILSTSQHSTGPHA